MESVSDNPLVYKTRKCTHDLEIESENDKEVFLVLYPPKIIPVISTHKALFVC